MATITCECGHKVEDEDHYKAEAKTWHHAIEKHSEMLKQMTPENLEQVLRGLDKQMGLSE
ncbi:MAG: hypothetical protein AABW65_00685 [Nanoarchaeota archaeon]